MLKARFAAGCCSGMIEGRWEYGNGGFGFAEMKSIVDRRAVSKSMGKNEEKVNSGIRSARLFKPEPTFFRRAEGREHRAEKGAGMIVPFTQKSRASIDRGSSGRVYYGTLYSVLRTHMRSRTQVQKAILLSIDNTIVAPLTSRYRVLLKSLRRPSINSGGLHISKMAEPSSRPQFPGAECKSEIILPWEVHGSRLVI